MALDFNQIEKLLIKNKSDSSLVDLIIEYSKLKQALNDTENHSWYFKQGIESKQQELWALADRFEKLRVLFNSSTIDCFINKINDNNDYLSDSEGNYRGFNHRTVCSWKRNENELFHEFIQLKSRIEFLMRIDYYLENPNEFLIFID